MANSGLAFDPVWAIAGMFVATFMTRAGGYWLIGRITLTPFVRRMLNALPGAIVMSTIVPIVSEGGPSAIFAIAAAGGIMLLWRNEFFAMTTGVVVAAFLRAVGF